jgi:hypothetical protein
LNRPARTTPIRSGRGAEHDRPRQPDNRAAKAFRQQNGNVMRIIRDEVNVEISA